MISLIRYKKNLLNDTIYFDTFYYNQIQREKMGNSNYTKPIIPPVQSDPNLKSYYCPHCDRFLFKGNVKKLNMVCNYCQKLISADAKDLVKSETE